MIKNYKNISNAAIKSEWENLQEKFRKTRKKLWVDF